MKEFYFLSGPAAIGPLTGIELREAALAGRVAADTLVANNAVGPWVAANCVKGLFDIYGEALPHPPSALRQIKKRQELADDQRNRGNMWPSANKNPTVESSIGDSKSNVPAAKQALSTIPIGFDLASVRCAVERHLDAIVLKDENLLGRIKGCSEELERSRMRDLLNLMTNGYRVDQALTPKISRLGTVLSKTLRLVRPLDIFVWPSHKRNAYCLPSRKGNRLIMCLYAGLVSSMSSRQLLFVMGHEVGHAILKHGEKLGVDFDNPHFSPLEVVRMRALERAHEISCDRFGLLACQDIRVASTALFKVASGLSERWMSFDETAYSRHFDEISSMSELIDIEDASRTHPIAPLRVKALIDFFNSETYANAFNMSTWSIPAIELERRIEIMLSIRDPDMSELEGKDEQKAANQFLLDGALLVITADGMVAPEELAWLDSHWSETWSGEELARNLDDPYFRQQLQQRLSANAVILQNKLSEFGRAKLLHIMCNVALCAGGIPDPEFAVLDELRLLLRLSAELAQSVLGRAEEDVPGESVGGSEESSNEATPGMPTDALTDPLESIVEKAKLPHKARVAARAMCEEIVSRSLPMAVGIRTLVSWAIGASRDGGQLSKAQGKKIAIAAIRICRDNQNRAGVVRKSRSIPIDKLIRTHGIVALFSRNENVYLGQEDQPYVIVSVSRAKNFVVIAPVDDFEATTKVDPHELRKDSIQGVWPTELTNL